MQVNSVLVVDNGSQGNSLYRLKQLAAPGNVTVIFNTQNRGIAAALNQGMSWAKQNHMDWLLTLDQDTLVGDDLVTHLLDVYAQEARKDDVACIGARYQAANWVPGSLLQEERGRDEVSDLITSGCLTSVEIFDKVGQFDEGFFIDHVDSEYCCRARASGFRLLRSRAYLMQHSIGQASTHHLLGRTTQTSNHSPLRRYYGARNLVIITRRYILSQPSYVLHLLYSSLKSLVLMLLFEVDREAKVRSFLRGVWDGLFGGNA